MKKTVALFTAVLLLCSLLAGCGTSPAANTPAPPPAQPAASGEPAAPVVEMENLGVAITIGTPHANVAVIAEEKGYFAEVGIIPDLQPYVGGTAMMEALPSGAWDICVVAIPGWIPGTVNHDVRIVGLGPWDHDGIDLSVRPDSDIALSGQGNYPDNPLIYGTADDWRGKSVLLPIGTPSHMTLLATLEAIGLTGDDVQITNMDVPSAFTAFKAGQGDILGSWTLHSVYAKEEGYVLASSAVATGVDIPIIICASDRIMNENPGLVEKFLIAYGKGAEYQQDNHEEAAQIMADWNNDQGFKTDVDSCYALVSTRSTDPYSVQLEQFQNGKIVDIARYNLDFFIRTGRYEEEIWEIMERNIVSDILERVVN